MIIEQKEEQKTEEQKFQDLIFGKSFEERQKESDLKEAQKQLRLLRDNMINCVSQTKELFEKGKHDFNKTLIQNMKYLQDDVLPKIDQFNMNLQKSIDEIEMKLKIRQTQQNLFECNGISKLVYNFIDQTMRQHYDMYELLWVQIFYFLDRKRVILNENSQKKMDLINKIIS